MLLKGKELIALLWSKTLELAILRSGTAISFARLRQGEILRGCSG
ncbi:MAG: hypothetical protein ABSA59_08420 [Terriglobia bacterium]|jgi:hypothetical protein